MCLTRVCIVAAVLLQAFSLQISAQESQSGTAKRVQAEMEQAFGTFPSFMKVYPEHLRAAAWEMEKARQSPEAAIPAKYSELIALAVASQIPCNYCVYYHTETAKMLGATEAELRETVATAAYIRHWSTILNGAGLDFEAFKAEFDKMLAYVKKQSAASAASKK